MSGLINIKMNIDEYIEEIERATDINRLQKELHVYDNWLVLFYGDPVDIYNSLVEDFRNSPRMDLMNTDWKTKGVYDHNYIFENMLDTVCVQIRDEVYARYIESYDTQINGQDHVAHLLFHAGFIDRIGTMHPDIKPAILNFLAYAKRKQYTFCLPVFDPPIISTP